MKALRRLLLSLAVASCGSLGDDPLPAAELPSAEMGPFRALQNEELKGTAPFVLDDSRAQYTDAAAMGEGTGVVLYAVTGGKIVRTRSLDGRTFFGIGQAGRSPATVLAPDQPWEGSALSGPAPLRLPSGEVLLVYAGAAGIGVARSADGLSFTKVAGPVLAGASPCVFALPGGELRMFFTTSAGIEEARSPDGIVWERLPGVVLAPSGSAEAFDGLRVGDPVAATRTTPAGRLHVRVLYTGTNAAGATAIGFAARYGEDGPLSRNPLPTFPSGAQPAYAPPFLYVTQARVSYPAIAAAIEPLDATLGPPADYPPSP